MQNVKTDRILQVLIGLVLIAFSYVVARALQERVVTVGHTAPDFSITADNGRRITRSDFGGRLLVLNFWATWCPPCIEEMPSLDRFQKQFANSGVIVLGISVDRNERTYRAFLNRAKVSFLTARDPAGLISADYGTFKYPESYIIDSQGKVVEKIIGPTTWTDGNMASRIQKFLGPS